MNSGYAFISSCAPEENVKCAFALLQVNWSRTAAGEAICLQLASVRVDARFSQRVTPSSSAQITLSHLSDSVARCHWNINGGSKFNLRCREKLQIGVIRSNYVLAGETCAINAFLSIHLGFISFPLSFTLSGNVIFLPHVSIADFSFLFFNTEFGSPRAHAP